MKSSRGESCGESNFRLNENPSPFSDVVYLLDNFSENVDYVSESKIKQVDFNFAHNG